LVFIILIEVDQLYNFVEINFVEIFVLDVDENIISWGSGLKLLNIRVH
jgi:hypothetical protein